MAKYFIAANPSCPGGAIYAHSAVSAAKVAAIGLRQESQFPGDVYVYTASRRYTSAAKLAADANAGIHASFVGVAADIMKRKGRDK